MKLLLLSCLMLAQSHVSAQSLSAEIESLRDEVSLDQNVEISTPRSHKRQLLRDLRTSRQDYKKYLNDPSHQQEADRMKQFQKAVVADPILQMRLKVIIDSCAVDQVKCEKDLDALVVEVVGQPTNTGPEGSHGTFGICTLDQKEKKDFHSFYKAKRTYSCKLSTKGIVYIRKIERKTYGPGIYTHSHSFLLACSGNAFGSTTGGLSYGAGLYYGLALGTTFGKPGVCVYIGAGKALGAFAGVDILKIGEM